MVEETQWRVSVGARRVIQRSRYTEREGVRRQIREYWYPSGAKQVEGRLRDDLETGEWVLWSEDGSVARRLTFEAGHLVRSDGTLTPPMLPEDPANDLPAVRKIRRALDDVTSLEFIRTPCYHVMQFLEDAHNTPLHIDEKKLREAGRDPDTQFTINLQGLLLRAALQLLLEEPEMAAVVRREALLITTPENTAEWRDQTGLPEVLADPATPLRERLQQIANAKWEQTPLRETLEHFRRHDLVVRLDESAFDDPRAILETPTTMRLRGITVASVLGFLLDEHNLACVEQNGQLLLRPR